MADINYVKVGGRMHSTSEDSNPANNHIMAGADEIYDDTKGKKQSVVNAETDATLATHTSQIQGYNNQNYVTVVATSLTTDATDVLPAEGSVDTVYRVGNWDGIQYDVTCYSEYSWSNNAYQHISTKPQIGEVFDISLYKASGGTLATFADLAAALDSGKNVPVDIRSGGMPVKFVQTYDNNSSQYVQYRYMGTEVTGSPNPFLDTANWQSENCDNTLIAGSTNLATSGAVEKELPIFNLVGNGDNVVKSSNYVVKAGNKYRVWIKNPNVSLDGVTYDTSNYLRFVVRAFNANNERIQPDCVNIGLDTRNVSLANYYDFTSPDTTEYIFIAIRAKVGETLTVWIEDISAAEGVADTDVPRKMGKNLLNPDTCLYQKGINKDDGTVINTTSYYVTDYIKVSENGLYCNKSAGFGEIGGWAVYNATKQYVRGSYGSTKAYTYQAGDVYIRFTISTLTNAQVEEGNTETDYEPYNPILGYLTNLIGTSELKDRSVTAIKIALNTIVEGNIANNAVIRRIIANSSVDSSKLTKLLADRIEEYAGYIGYSIIENGKSAFSAVSSDNYFTIKTGTIIKNLGVGVILGSDSSLTQRKDLDTNNSWTATFDVNYIQISSTAGDVIIEVNGIGIPIKNNSVSTSKLQNGAVTIDKVEFKEIAYGTNRANPATCTYGKYIDYTDGVAKNVGSAAGNERYITDYIGISELGLYCGGYSLYGSLGKGAVYNVTKQYIRGISEVYSYQEGDAYVRWTVSKSSVETPTLYVIEGTQEGEYTPYVESKTVFKEQYIPQIDGENIKNHTVGTDKFTTDAALPALMPALSLCGKDSNENTIATITNSNLSISTFPQYLKANGIISLSAKITAFNSICLGFGTGDYSIQVYITGSQYAIRRSGNAIHTPIAHGLTIEDFINVTFEVELNKQKVVIASSDGIYVHEFSDLYGLEAYGVPTLVVDSSTTLTDVAIRATSDRFKKPIWVVGDSYTSLYDERWTKQLINTIGIKSFLLIGLAGGTSSQLYADLQKALSFGTPKFLVWCLGMNDTYTAWNTTYQALKALCLSIGTELVLQTIPIPNLETSQQQTDINTAVKSSGLRFIDACAAMCPNNTWPWYSGYCADGVHPTELGAKVLASRFLSDFPEFMQ